MKQLIHCVVMAILLISCGQKPKIDYENQIDTTEAIDDQTRDTTKMLVSELPVKFDSTDVLIFAIELVDLDERGGYSKTGSISYTSSDMSSSYYSNDYLSGNFVNLIFRNNGEKERKLTENKIRIRSATFVREIFNKTKTGYLLYTVYDRDTNADKDLDSDDLEALYIGRIDGTDFKKITKELHEFYDYNIIADESRLYFRTLEDKNKDGDLTNKDRFHYYYIEFSGDRYTVTEYNPLKIFE